MNRIEELRKRFGVTQTQLGRAIGASQNTICNWELGKREPDHAALGRLADYFGVSVDYILGRNEIKREVEDDDLKVALFGGGEEVTDEMWEEVRRFAQYIKQTRGK